MISFSFPNYTYRQLKKYCIYLFRTLLLSKTLISWLLAYPIGAETNLFTTQEIQIVYLHFMQPNQSHSELSKMFDVHIR